MLNQRLDALNGGKKLTLAQIKKGATLSAPGNDDAYAKAMIGYIQKVAVDEARQEFYEEMKETVSSIQSKVDLIDKAKREQDAMHKELQKQLLETNSDLKGLIGKLTDEIKDIRSNSVSKEMDAEISVGLQKTALKEVELKLANSLGQLAKAEQHINELRDAAKQMPLPLVVNNPIPSFKFTPVKDRNGNTVEVIATPIGA